jgi:hypothetical protein
MSDIKKFLALKTGQIKAETIHLLSAMGELVDVGTHADLLYDEVHTITEEADGEHVKRHTEIEQGEVYADDVRFTSYSSLALAEVLIGSTDNLADALKAGWTVVDADKAKAILDEKAKADEAAQAKQREVAQAAQAEAAAEAAKVKATEAKEIEAWAKSAKVPAAVLAKLLS